MPDLTRKPLAVNRRTALTAAGLGIGGFTLAACTDASPSATKASGNTAGADYTAAITAAEADRPHTGRTVAHKLTARRTEIDLGGPVVRTLAYGDTVPGDPIRANVGDELAVTVSNRLDRATSVHWHGLALRNDMDGAAPATPDIAKGDTFTYRFTSPHPGTYWAHPHTGMDTDYGLYLPVIIDDPNEKGDYDAEWIVVLDDWTDGVGKTPEAIQKDLGSGGMSHDMGDGMDHNMDDGDTTSLLGDDTGDVDYPHYLVNGRIPNTPATFNAKAGQRVRIRIINAGADTPFRVALADHTMTVTHTDGFPIRPVERDAVLLGMGERVDVTIT
ncbi:MAG: multicopper oxidase family protein, partial [Tomitella sp.]|nr:multicopper oxidase family protein [Tomitella sp.]